MTEVIILIIYFNVIVIIFVIMITGVVVNLPWLQVPTQDEKVEKPFQFPLV